MTFLQLDRATDQLAYAFEENGITRGSRNHPDGPPLASIFSPLPLPFSRWGLFQWWWTREWG